MPSSLSSTLLTENVKAHFEENFRSRGEVGASVSVWADSGEILSLAGGFEDLAHSKPWTSSSRVLVWSATKGISAASLLHALDALKISTETPVSKIWPQFAASGKDCVTIRMILQHQAGLCALDNPPPVQDREAVTTALAAQAPAWKPGTIHGYHPRTFGFLVDEIMRRVTGLPLGTYWQQQLATPLHLEFWIGLPNHLLENVAPVLPPKGTLSKDDPFLTAFMTPGSLTSRSFASPRGLHSATTMNDPDARLASYPGWGGIGTASALAQFYSILANDGCFGSTRVFSKATLREIHTERIQGPDQVLQIPTAFSLGFMRDPILENGSKMRQTFGPSPNAFGHPGAGGSVAFADPDRRIGCAYVMNQMEPGVLPNLKGSGLWEALLQNTP